MKKEDVIILVIVAFIIGFVAGGITGIKFYAKNMGEGCQEGPPKTDAHAVNAPDRKKLEATARDEPANLVTLVELGNAYFDSNRYPQAIDTYKKAIALDQGNPDVRTDLGIMYRAVKDYDGAIREFKEAARQDLKHKNSRFNLGIVLQMDMKDMARAQLEQLKELSK
jgi:tetratricopeptide (TPR) repeat protein